MSEATVWRAKPSVIYTRLNDGEGVLLCLEQKAYFGLNETGCLVWDGVERGATEQEMAAALEQVYEISLEEAAAVVAEFTRQLERDGLVESAEAE